MKMKSNFFRPQVLFPVGILLLIALVRLIDDAKILPAEWDMPFKVVSILILIGVVAVFMTYDITRSAAAVEQKEAEIQDVQEEIAEKELSLVELLDRAIRLAIKREEASMLRADGRANMLFRVGLVFMIASVLAPVFSALFYWNLDPLPPSTVQTLKDVRTALGALPPGTTVPVQRDWRVLFGGISFGFLFLAAAAGLMKQQARQTDIYFRIGERIKFFERLVSVIRIHSAAVKSDGVDRELVTLVTGKLLLTDSTVTESSEQEIDGATSGSAVADILRLVSSSR